MTLKKLVHIMLVMLATMVVTSVMDVLLKTAMTYLATCQFTETRDEGIFKNCRQHYICICLATVADFCFYRHSICIFDFNISQLFLLHSYPPKIIDISRATCEYLKIQQVGIDKLICHSIHIYRRSL